MLGEGGLIQRAQEGKDLTEQAGQDEQDELKGSEEFINGVLSGTGTTNPPAKLPETVKEGKETGTAFEDTTTITDDLDNEVTVPGGFNIAEDSGTKVEEGIVIEDSNDNQFVWIPVGEYNISTTINSTGKLTNELSRRTFTTSSSTPVNGDSVIEEYYYGEGNENSVAKDQIDAFKTSSTTNKGFYMGRYEQGEGNVCKAGINPYVYVTRDEAKTQAEAMYSGNKFITSELVSSYAWDTALNFICQTNKEGYLLAMTTDASYGNINTGNNTKTGEYEADKYSNIYDFLGNCWEWTTEYTSDTKYGSDIYVIRGSKFVNDYDCAASRNGYSISYGGSNNDYSFRLQLYINPES